MPINEQKIHSSPVGVSILIEGVTNAGEIFRPSDWAERLCGALSTFKKNRIIYSPFLTPSISNGQKCVLLSKCLKDINPELYLHILEFAQENNLKRCDVLPGSDTPTTT